MNELDYIHLDPEELVIDPVNERKNDVNPQNGDDSLVESIRQTGVIDPIVVRQRNGRYSVIAGQRRTIAAQIAQVAMVPVRVMDMSDTEARMVSITENTKSFSKTVSAADRAQAIARLQDETDWNQSQIAEQIGVSQTTISRWGEPARPAWAGTPISPDEDGEVSADDLSNACLQLIRRHTPHTPQRVALVKFVREHDISISQVEEAAHRASAPKAFERELHELITDQREQTTVVRTSVRFRDDTAEAITTRMKDYGTSADEVIEHLVEQALQDTDSQHRPEEHRTNETLSKYLPADQ